VIQEVVKLITVIESLFHWILDTKYLDSWFKTGLNWLI